MAMSDFEQFVGGLEVRDLVARDFERGPR